MNPRTFAGGCLLWWCAAVAAAPADDYLRGQQALQRGDVTAAMNALRSAADAGDARSMAVLGSIYEGADFTDEAARLYGKAAALGDMDGHAGLANMYLSGRGIAKDEKLALQHFSKAADLGHAHSVEVVAAAWVNGRMGLDARAHPEEARAAIQRAAEHKHLPSVDALVAGYRQGLYGLPVDPQQMAVWQSRGAEWRKQRSTAQAKTTK
jgi:TPR repeat protein